MTRDTLYSRNLSCIGCGYPRVGERTPSPNAQQMYPTKRYSPSPRFLNTIDINAWHSLSSSSPGTPGSVSSFSATYSSQTPQTPISPATQFFTSQSPRLQTGYPLPNKSIKTDATGPSALKVLTPSGSAFAVNGKVQNVSPDPLSPCVMFWPENEPFPALGQIRPAIPSGTTVRA